MCDRIRVAFWCAVVAVVVCGVATDDVDLREELRVIGKQVAVLLERRTEDLRTIEEHMRRKLGKSQELVDVREEIKNLRSEIDQLRSGHRIHHLRLPQPSSNQEKNDHLTLKWLSGVVAEAKMELGEVQKTLNVSTMLENREKFEGELALLRTDVGNLNKELEASRNSNARYEAEIQEMREEINSVRDLARAAASMCGKNKNQLKSAQLEWNFNWKNLAETRQKISPKEHEFRPSRHQRLLKKHILDLEKSTGHLLADNKLVQKKIQKLQQDFVEFKKTSTADLSNEIYDRINGNEVENYLNQHKIAEIKPQAEEKFNNLQEQQNINTNLLVNLTKQYSNFDKLHLSMLELLENVESIENRVEKALPEFRKEISKLESQVSEGVSKFAALKEDQDNTRASMKAISVSVSNLQDKTDLDHKRLATLEEEVKTLKTSSSVQTSKLHDYILKSESSTADTNATKSTIHLVQELKSFEKEYKSIVNKLPHDCGAVSGPNGVYLISPGDGEPILAYCSQGWTTVQKRYDGSVEFNRNWNDYSNGFGSATGEHWLGNRNLNHLTEGNCTKLEINMKDIYGKYWTATYDEFTIADYANGFKLVVGKYHGNASDALDYQNKMEFSTVDNDRDISNTHCASNYEGGWWFSHCQHANLNGRYNLGLTWFDSSRNEWIAVSTSEMRVKRRDVC